jgi:hypothetical protein
MAATEQLDPNQQIQELVNDLLFLADNQFDNDQTQVSLSKLWDFFVRATDQELEQFALQLVKERGEEFIEPNQKARFRAPNSYINKVMRLMRLARKVSIQGKLNLSRTINKA